ncbi:TonB-dependent receptor [Sphingomonas sp. 1P06PA]|uniref:TonB-dependent receptor domain-containing protein n=1 Tax=Sphingomonas sp. 1P06PA TaxID=554121 RepID=UPI0039A64DB9
MARTLQKRDWTVTNSTKFLNRRALSASAASFAIGIAMCASPVFAQTVPAEAEAPIAEGGDSDVIVVTGSLISNPNLEQSTPVAVVGAEEIALRQSNVAEELLRDLPGAVPSVGSAVNNGNGGQSFVNLRGLGSNRNIVLLNGERIVPGDLVGRVDLNNIPLALVDRLDVLTGGASTTYGADAISGVVNFITKRDFAGVELNASNQITERGDGNFVRVDLTTGANFDDGRGNATFSIGYQQSDPVYQGDRMIGMNTIDSFTGANSGSGTSIPSRFTRPGAATQQINPTTGALVPTFQLFNFAPFNVFQTPFERFNMFGQARYEVTDGIEVYTRGLFSKNTVNTIIAPSGIFGSSVVIPYSNPYLPAAARAQFCASNGLSVAQCNAAAAATSPTDPNFRTFSTNVSRRTTEAGPRISDFSTTIFDYRAGVRGAITDTINFDVSGAYGESENKQTLQGYVLTSRVRSAAYATNTTSCLGGAPGGADIGAGSGCVPINLFGPEGSILANQIPYVTGESTSTVRSTLAQARAVINGDFGVSSPLAEEPIGFAIGAEYRKYRAQQRSDTLAQTAGELGGAGGAAPNIDGGYSVYEGFAELIAPLISDRPFFQSLTLEAGVRRSKYTIVAPFSPTFKTTTYKVGGSWEPVDSLKIRGNYARAVRAPNIGELFSPVSTGLTNLADDPCASLDENGVSLGRGVPTGELRAICLAQGAPIGQVNLIQVPTAGQANITAGGNTNVGPEKSNSYTIGAVIQPTFFSGFSLSVDYYNIKVTGAITTPTPGDLIAACFGTDPQNPAAGASTSAACTSIRRNPVTGGLDGDPAIAPGLFGVLSNLGRLSTDGIDLTANYRTDLGFAGLNMAFNGNWTNTSKFKATPTDVNRECTGYYSINCGSIQPEFTWNLRTTLSFDDVDVSVLWRHIDNVQFEPLQRDLDGDAYQGPVAGFDGDRDFNKIKAYDYFDLAVKFGVTDNFDLTLTGMNLFDKKPPLVGSTIGSTSFNSGNTYPSTYDALGRRFAAGARLKF